MTKGKWFGRLYQIIDRLSHQVVLNAVDKGFFN